MSDQRASVAPNRDDESPEERLDRNLAELVNELRVALPGVQVLFAFLLVVPFNQRFAAVQPFELGAYVFTLFATAAASIFLIAPSVHHRLRFRQADKEALVVTGNRLAIIGLTFLALAMTGVVLLVTGFLFSGSAAAIATAAMGLAFIVVWFAIPLRRSLRDR